MKLSILALALTGARAYVAPVGPKASMALNGKAEMVELAESNPDFLGQQIGFWDPFNLIAEGDFWGIGNEATIGYLRHAEIKHGRVAMAAFFGFLFQSLPAIAGDHIFAPYRGYVAGATPQVQWDNVPAIGKLQILIAIGMLESYGEGAGNPEGYVHYCNGGKPGYYPPISGRAGFGQVGLDLYQPFDIFPEQSEAAKARGRQCEINNGRAAMLGIFSLLSEAAAPGAVPPITLLNYVVEASGVTNIVLPLKSALGGLPIVGDIFQDVQLIPGFPYYDVAAATPADAWSQFDIFSSLPVWY